MRGTLGLPPRQIAPSRPNIRVALRSRPLLIKALKTASHKVAIPTDRWVAASEHTCFVSNGRPERRGLVASSPCATRQNWRSEKGRAAQIFPVPFGDLKTSDVLVQASQALLGQSPAARWLARGARHNVYRRLKRSGNG